MATRTQVVRVNQGASGQITTGALPKSSRVLRSPAHSFQLRLRPWQIQPFMIAPVLPGETMTNAVLQARSVTDPLKNPIVGWWSEFYLFYVRHRDLPNSEEWQNMVLQPGYDVSSLYSAANSYTYHYGGTVNWVQECLEAVTAWYFRDAEEAWNASGATLDNLPLAKTADRQFLDSLKLESENPTGISDLPGQGHDIPDFLEGSFATAYTQWQQMRELQLTELTYADWLRQFGVRPPREVREEILRPELLRYVRDWTYPSNTIDPADGSPVSACSWATAERADKDRHFTEPGFIFGVCVFRPKVYRSTQKGAAVGMLNDAYSWLPALLWDQPYTSLKEFDHDKGPLNGLFNSGDDYWLDARDLFVHGDQFVNFDMAATDDNSVPVPTSAGTLGSINRDYVTSTVANSLFVDDDASDGLNKIRVDGIVRLSIRSHVRDTT